MKERVSKLTYPGPLSYIAWQCCKLRLTCTMPCISIKYCHVCVIFGSPLSKRYRTEQLLCRSCEIGTKLHILAKVIIVLSERKSNHVHVFPVNMHMLSVCPYQLQKLGGFRGDVLKKTVSVIYVIFDKFPSSKRA